MSIPDIKFSTSVHLDPRQRVEKHGLEVSLDAGTASMDVDVVRYLLDTLKQAKVEKEDIEDVMTSPPPASPPPRSPPLSPRASRIGWASPMSPGSPLMEALSVRLRHAFGIFTHRSSTYYRLVFVGNTNTTVLSAFVL